ncbi:MAG: hypothetical protein IID01_10315 [Chloroflexi bacterium]|nr:hypothetical protein [Chloroflexota bacterium]
MARKMIVEGTDGIRRTLIETLADSEAELELFLKENPDLFPIEELDLPGPMMVVAVQAQVPSGAVDMVGLARTGDVIVLEFKTGPQNPDFRNVLAQLLDYGSHIWNMSFERFETSVAKTYFSSDRCQDSVLKGKASLVDAATEFWDGFSEEDASGFENTLSARLQTGAFHYAVVAQRITKEIQQTIEYLNGAMVSARFFGVEVVKFAGAEETAYEARTVVKPSLKRITKSSGTPVNRMQFLEELIDDDYRQAMANLFDHFEQQGLRFEWGSTGTSVRYYKSGMSVPISIVWAFPPGRRGWGSFVDLTLGYDSLSVEVTEPVKSVLENFANRASKILGSRLIKNGSASGHHFAPEVVVASENEIQLAVADVVEQLRDVV